MFGLSDETPILQNPMCNGTEYTLSDCPGYELNNVVGDYCLSGNYQAGVRCVEGRYIHSRLFDSKFSHFLFSAYTNYSLL